MKINGFKDWEEYSDWLKYQPDTVADKAELFAREFGAREIPVVLIVEVDKNTPEEHRGWAYIFLHNSLSLAWMLGEMITDH